MYEGLQKLEIVDIALKYNYDNPQLIFESLNSKGVQLSQADLMRNYVLMGQKRKFQKKLYDTYWDPMERCFGKEYTKRFDRFIEAYLTLKSDLWDLLTENKKGVYESFKGYMDDKKHPEALETAIAEINHYSKHYIRIALLKEEDSDIRACFEDIQALGDISGINIDVAFPFLLAVCEDYTQEQIEKAEMIEILRLTESYIFRRAICGSGTRDLSLNFAALMTLVDKNNYLQSLKVAFAQQMTFPSDRDFKREFLNKDIYKEDTPNYLCNYLLHKLENYERKEKGEEPIREGYTIEHVMPQNPV